MNTVLMLVAKDTMQQVKRMILGGVLMVGMAALTASGGASPSIVGTVLVVMTTVTTMATLFEEERNHGLQFLRSLPLSPAFVVAGKFLSVAAFVALYAATGIGALAVVGGLDALRLAQMAASSAVGLLLAGVGIVAFYRYGYQAIQWFYTGIFLVVISLSVFVPMAADAAPALRAWVQDVLPWAVAALDRLVAWVATNRAGGAILGVAFLAAACLFLGSSAARGLARREL